MVRQALATFGQIDILVNNAGVTRRADIMELTEADWDRIHRVNAKGVFFCLQRVAREMIPRRSGRIINIASIAGKGYEGTSNAAYAASKGAVISLTKTAALAKHNINVNSVTYCVVGRQPARSGPAGRRDTRRTFHRWFFAVYGRPVQKEMSILGFDEPDAQRPRAGAGGRRCVPPGDARMARRSW
jgi:NAD(P)-dependent dehydrogenase (short-subunit alcohol dehydrogenase family)